MWNKKIITMQSNQVYKMNERFLYTKYTHMRLLFHSLTDATSIFTVTQTTISPNIFI